MYCKTDALSQHLRVPDGKDEVETHCRCCRWCIEKIIGYLNKNAYIMAATHGHSFCTGLSPCNFHINMRVHDKSALWGRESALWGQAYAFR